MFPIRVSVWQIPLKVQEHLKSLPEIRASRAIVVLSIKKCEWKEIEIRLEVTYHRQGLSEHHIYRGPLAFGQEWSPIWWNREIVWYSVVRAQGCDFSSHAWKLPFIPYHHDWSRRWPLWRWVHNAFVTGNTNSHRPDLYGNDGAEEQPQEENDTQQQQPAPEAPTESPPSASMPAEQASLKLLNIETIQPNGTTLEAPPPNGALSS